MWTNLVIIRPEVTLDNAHTILDHPVQLVLMPHPMIRVPGSGQVEYELGPFPDSLEGAEVRDDGGYGICHSAAVSQYGRE